MIEILPAILEKSFGLIQDKVEKLKGVAARAHLDIADGFFVPETSWQEQERLSELGAAVKFDLHLMVDKPEQWIGRWNHASIFRVTFHQEATYDVVRTVRLIRERGKEVGVALKLETPVSAIYDIMENVDMILLLAVAPGAQGREFDARVMEKLKELRQASSTIKIGVDGGVSPLVASSLIVAGANVLVSGSYIWGQEDIAAAIESLKIENS